jgi:hypothetical protein
MPCTRAQQALDQAQSIAFMRNCYASLAHKKGGTRARDSTQNGASTGSPAPVFRRRPGRPRRKINTDRPLGGREP